MAASASSAPWPAPGLAADHGTEAGIAWKGLKGGLGFRGLGLGVRV